MVGIQFTFLKIQSRTLFKWKMGIEISSSRNILPLSVYALCLFFFSLGPFLMLFCVLIIKCLQFQSGYNGSQLYGILAYIECVLITQRTIMITI